MQSRSFMVRGVGAPRRVREVLILWEKSLIYLTSECVSNRTIPLRLGDDMGSLIDYPISEGTFSSPSYVLIIGIWHNEWDFPTTGLREVLLLREPFPTKLL